MAAALTDFKALSFDCYGTLINWESGIFAQLAPLLAQLPADHKYKTQDTVIARFNEFQGSFERNNPATPYNEILAMCYSSLAAELDLPVNANEATQFGKRVGDWNAFPDTVEGLRVLKKYYKLIILSNVDNQSLANTLKRALPVEFDAVLTAQDIQSYKPDHQNFRYLFDTLQARFGLTQTDLLHVAKSLPVDHVPAKALGLTSAWIARGADGVSAMGGNLKDYQDDVAFTWRFSSIGELAEAVEEAFAAKQTK